jgi:hypothetical protein
MPDILLVWEGGWDLLFCTSGRVKVAGVGVDIGDVK